MSLSGERSTVVVSGGAGYLGRSMLEGLCRAGIAPVCLDNYSTSRPFEDSRVSIFEVDITDAAALRAVWKKLPPVNGIFHFAARALVSESVLKPAEYFRNNLLCTLNLAEIAAEEKIPFIHSSSCAVYGVPQTLPIDETAPHAPISPYGETKRLAEEMLKQFSSARGLKTLNLRYFNPSGALDGAHHGEAHEPETHLIPNVLRAGLQGRAVPVFGTDHPTPDGSCVRDYIHVEDLIEGHARALKFLKIQPEGFWDCVNLGSGRGVSVLQVVSAAERVLNRKLEIDRRPARPGDPPTLIASIEKAKQRLGWSPSRGLDEMLQSHLYWENR